jgi:XTP/dITP diphosphohydrolase
MSSLLLASNNPGKQRELRDLLENLSFTLVTPAEIGLELHVEESGEDYAANATLKATAFARKSGFYTLADDSGLEVEALHGAPGKRSARIARGSDADRRRYLLDLLQSHPRPWRARFFCALALAAPDGSTEITTGICPGEIIPDERGGGGFGYDPIFLVQGTDQTMAELSVRQKNRISHRANALSKMLPILKQRLGMWEA